MPDPFLQNFTKAILTRLPEQSKNLGVPDLMKTYKSTGQKLNFPLTGNTGMGGLSPTFQKYMNTIGDMESKNSYGAIEKGLGNGKFIGSNTTPGIGRFQFTGNTFRQYSGGMSPGEFAKNPAAQNNAFIKLTQDNASRYNNYAKRTGQRTIDLNNLSAQDASILGRMHNTGGWTSNGTNNYGTRAAQKFIQG